MELKARTDPRRCPLCHDPLGQGSLDGECPECGVRHHSECLHEFGRCGTLGCGDKAEPPRRRRATTTRGRGARSRADLVFLASAALVAMAFFSSYYGWQGLVWGALFVATAFVLPKRG